MAEVHYHPLAFHFKQPTEEAIMNALDVPYISDRPIALFKKHRGFGPSRYYPVSLLAKELCDWRDCRYLRQDKLDALTSFVEVELVA